MSISKEWIEENYGTLGYRHGWTLMYTPEQAIRTAKVAFVGLNPGGGGPGDNHIYSGIWDEPEGNAYFQQDWGAGKGKAPIQVQVQKWHEMLEIPGSDSLCIQFVPFRSPSWGALENRDQAVAISKIIWRWVLQVSPATLFVTMGKVPALYLTELLEAEHLLDLPTGWGSQRINVWQSATGRRIVGMPHPSRYRLFGRSDDASLIAEESFKVATGR